MAVNKHQDKPRKPIKTPEIILRKDYIKKYFDKYIQLTEKTSPLNQTEFLPTYLQILKEAEEELNVLEYNTLRRAIINDLKLTTTQK